MHARVSSLPLGLPAGEVHVWVARPGGITDATLAECAGLLSEEERAHVARFRFERHRRESTVTRALVRSTLARYLGIPPEAVSYDVGPHGKPSLAAAIAPVSGLGLELGFNATNHPGLVACAVSRFEEIGADTEPVTRGEEILQVAASVFSPPELDALAALPADERADRAVSLWTCKEAYIKARGLGFAASLQQIVVDFPRSRPPQLRFLDGYDEPGGWWLDVRDVTGFRIAVAVRGAATKVVIFESEWGDDAAAADPRR